MNGSDAPRHLRRGLIEGANRQLVRAIIASVAEVLAGAGHGITACGALERGLVYSAYPNSPLRDPKVHPSRRLDYG
jgi:hypothetical protein